MDNNQIAEVTGLAIQGMSIRAIESTTGINRGAIQRTLAKPEIRSKIEKEAIEIINRGLKPARRTLTRLAAEGNKGKDPAMLKLALDASKHITGMAGLSGNTPSTIINTLIQVNQAPQESQEVNDIRAYILAQCNNRIIDIQDNNTPVGNTIQQYDKHTGIGIATPHTEIGCAESAQFDDKQEPCQDAEVEGIQNDPPDQTPNQP